MTEQNTNSNSIGGSILGSYPMEKAEQQPSTLIPAAMVTHLPPTIHHPDTEMAETVVRCSFLIMF